VLSLCGDTAGVEGCMAAAMTKREIVGILVTSPFYLRMALMERLRLVREIFYRQRRMMKKTQ
jgi:lipopolysaccharide/colanic/teichoic acid biosynthesis glycosyltransferase